MKKYGKWLLLGVCLFWCGVIFSFSLSTGSGSAATSGRVLALLNGTLEKMNAPFAFTAVAVRKMAHFAEFFVLGVLAAATLRAHGFGHPFVLAPACCLAVAAADETLQAFVPGRGPHVLDVLLDFGGAVCGVLAFLVLYLLIIYKCKKRFRKSEKNT